MTAVVEVHRLRRRFGAVLAVSDVSFSMERGQVLGFIGANGAGKTTTMRILATLDLPDAGQLRLCGFDAVNYPDRVRERIGWMPDSYGTYSHTTVWEYLDFFARAFGLTGEERETAVEDVIAFTNLEELREREMSALSKGMTQRLCLGRALLNDPEVLILDEPAAGLDPKARVEFKRLVRLLAADGKTILISSHILSELEEMCDSVLFIDEGRVVHHGSAESLKLSDDETGGTLYAVALALAAAPPGATEENALASWADMQPGVDFVESTRTGARIRLRDAAPAAVAEVLRRLVNDGFAVVDFRREEKRLEQAFIETLDRSPGGRHAPEQ